MTITCSKWLQAASIAVSDHELPRDLDRINLKVHWGSNPKDATLKLSKADKMEDLKVTNFCHKILVPQCFTNKSQNYS
jgi:hypothetical protein